MSQWTLVKSNMNDINCIKQVLDELGCQYDDSQSKMKAEGRSVDVDLILNKNASISSTVGFTKNKAGSYEMVMAAYSDKKTQQFLNTVKQNYMSKKIMQQMRGMSCTVTSRVVDSDGKIRLKAMVG